MATVIAGNAAETGYQNLAQVMAAVSFQTQPAGRTFTLDGATASAQTTGVLLGPHLLSVASPQTGTAGTQYVFTGWSDGGAATHLVNVTGSTAASRPHSRRNTN